MKISILSQSVTYIHSEETHESVNLTKYLTQNIDYIDSIETLKLS